MTEVQLGRSLPAGVADAHAGCAANRHGLLAGYGITAVMEGGKLLEKAAANITVVKGVLSPTRAQVRGCEPACPVVVPTCTCDMSSLL